MRYNVPAQVNPQQERRHEDGLQREMNEQEPQEGHWRPVTPAQFSLFSGCMAMFLLVLLSCEQGFVPLLDHTNLVFHEAGHLFTRFLCAPLEVYGGTIGQFVFPIVIIVGFWQQRAPLSFAAGWVWLFENFFNVARYMADAREQVLPLVGGGEHDWNNIFDAWGLLNYDTAIATGVTIAGWIGIAAVWGWAAWRAWASRKARSMGSM